MLRKRFIPSCNSGFTLLELLIAAAVAVLVVGSALALVISNRRIYELDRVRTDVNQNLRSGLDLVGNDVRLAGENLPPNLPAVEIINGTGSNPDTLILRRNVSTLPLTVCNNLSGGTSVIQVADTGVNPIAGCQFVDENTNGIHDPLEGWIQYRTDNGGQVQVYAYNAATQVGEFFTYIGEPAGGTSIQRSAGMWQNTYTAGSPIVIYTLEQRVYQVSNGILQAVVTGQNNVSQTLSLVRGISNFQATATMKTGATTTTVSSLAGGPTYNWKNIVSINVVLSGAQTGQGTSIQRTLSAQFFPRNILSP